MWETFSNVNDRGAEFSSDFKKLKMGTFFEIKEHTPVNPYFFSFLTSKMSTSLDFERTDKIRIREREEKMTRDRPLAECPEEAMLDMEVVKQCLGGDSILVQSRNRPLLEPTKEAVLDMELMKQCAGPERILVSQYIRSQAMRSHEQ